MRLSTLWSRRGFLSSLLQHRKRNVEVHYHSQTLPRRLINHVHCFLFFVGYARSGHSIIASMLDAHPNVVIAHKYALFVNWEHEPASTAIRLGCSMHCTTIQGSVCTEVIGYRMPSRRAILLLSLGHGREDMTHIIFHGTVTHV